MSTQGNYDAIVIGSGAGGLTAGLQLAWQGQRVLIAEQRDAFGGFSYGEHEGEYIWDHGGHLLFAMHPGGYFRNICDHFGLTELLELMPVEDTMRAIFPDREVFIPLDRDGFERALSSEYPRHRPAIKQFLHLVQSIAAEVMAVAPVFQVELQPQRGRLAQLRKQPLFQRTLLATRAFTGGPGRTLLRRADQTLNELLDEAEVQDEQLRNDLSILSILFGVRPHEVSAVGLSIFYDAALRTQYMPRFGFRTIAEALHRRFTEVGGTLRTGARVSRILQDGKRASGVELASGERIRARAVVADISPLAMLDLVGQSALPQKYVQRLRSMRPSPSIFQVMLGSDVPIPEGTARMTGLFGPKGTSVSVSAIENGHVSLDSMAVLASPLSHPDYAPAGSGSFKLETFVPFGAPGFDWDKEKDDLAERIIAWTETVLPGLKSHIREQRIRTPLDLARDTAVPFGTALGWDLIPSQSGANRTSPITPIDGLYLTGAWTQPGPGVSHVVISGLYSANLALVHAGA
jgi:prolycopene isomerase